jgi:hypothetical protein
LNSGVGSKAYPEGAKPEGANMQNSKAKDERPIPAYETRRTEVASELRQILGMRHLWVVDADGKRLEPKSAAQE